MSFDQLFRLVSARKVGGGQKATPSDQKVFVGFASPWTGVRIKTTIRLIEPKESFYTSSNMRLRDSKVGQSGHYIHVDVGSPITHQLADQLRHIVQKADALNRPAYVRWERS